mgnify:CR=1 FL=1
MKWDVKHDRAKRVIDAFLDNAAYWTEREDLVEGLSEEEQELVSQEISVMIESIRNRYKLQVRLPEQKEEVKKEDTVHAEEKPAEEAKEVAEKPAEEAPKKKRGRKPKAKKEEVA